MKSIRCKHESVQGLSAPIRSAAFVSMVFALASCGSSGDDGGNQNQGGSTVPTDGVAGQSSRAGGVQAISAAGNAGGLQVGAGGGKVATGVGGKATTGAGGKAATAGKGGTKGSAGAGGKATDAGTKDVACNPADKTAAPTVVTSWSDTDTPPTGPYKVVIESDPGIPTHTIYRPEVTDKKMPIIAWGEGGCINAGMIMVQFLYDVASHGFLIVADGVPAPDAIAPSAASGEAQTKAMDWAIAENERPCSQYYHKLDTTKISVSGQSCGGLMTYYAAADPRVTTAVIWNSGLFARDQAVYDALHAPMAYFIGGSSDVAYANAEADWAAISPTAKFPIFYGNNNYGHGGTYNADNGGELAQVGVAWWRWYLMGDEGPTGKQMFWGKNCGMCSKSGWTVERVNMDQ